MIATLVLFGALLDFGPERPVVARPELAYARIAEEHGRVLRAFVRTTLPAKHRTVRR